MALQKGQDRGFMSRKKKNPEDSSLSIYKRLGKYFLKCKGHVIIGVIAGIVCGGSTFGILSSLQPALSVFEQGDKSPADTQVVSNNVALATSDKPREPKLDGLNKKVESGEEKLARYAKKLGVDIKDSSGRMTWQFLVLLLIFFPINVCFRVLAVYLNRFSLRWVGSRVIRDLRAQMFDSLQSQSLSFFGKADVGELISRATNDAAVVENIISVTIADLARAPIDVLACLIFVIVSIVSNKLGGFIFGILIFFPLIILPIVILGNVVKRYTRKALGHISDVVGRMHETITCVKVVKAYNTEDMEREKFNYINTKYFRTIIKALRAELLMGPLMEGIGMLLGMAFIVICYAQEIQFSKIIPIVIAAVIIYQPLKRIARMNANIQKGAAALARIFNLIDEDTSIVEADNPIIIKSFEKGIEFNHVDFKYEENGKNIISDVSFSLGKGTTIAVVGETGSGKSTLSNLLARFYDPIAGTITMDGVDFKDIELKSLRKMIGVVSQETLLFNTTIAENISYGMENATQEEIIEAAKKANAHEFIIKDQDGYDKVVGEKGFLLSGGERQRVALARAILKNPPILILDEATSALDTVTERLVQEAIIKLMENRTVFSIAHRLSTIKHSNQILLLDNGVVAERGTHDELYKMGGKYHSLCDVQFDG
jgi:subfamily B ATP-binding cassette protein MsbA